MKNGLTVKIQEKGVGTIILLSGQLTRATFKKLDYLLSELTFDDITYYAFNMENLSYMDAKGLEIISKFMTNLSRRKIRLFAFGMNNEIFDILDSVDFAQDLKLINSENEIRQVIKSLL